MFLEKFLFSKMFLMSMLMKNTTFSNSGNYIGNKSQLLIFTELYEVKLIKTCLRGLTIFSVELFRLVAQYNMVEQFNMVV